MYAYDNLKLEGHYNRKVAKMLNIERKTASKYCNEYKGQTELLGSEDTDVKTIQETICSTPAYNSSGRKPRKYTEEMDRLVDEQEKCKLLGNNKQKLTQLQIYEIFKRRKFDISQSTIGNKIRGKRNK